MKVSTLTPWYIPRSVGIYQDMLLGPLANHGSHLKHKEGPPILAKYLCHLPLSHFLYNSLICPGSVRYCMVNHHHQKQTESILPDPNVVWIISI